MLVQAVVVDFDASFTEDQGTADQQSTWTEVRRLKAAGITVILNTGRTLDYLVGPTGVLSWDRLALFDMIVAENGAIAWEPRPNRIHGLGDPISPFFIDALRRTAQSKKPENRIDPAELWPGLASVSTMRDRLGVGRRVLQRRNAFLRRKGIAPISVVPIVNGGSVTWVSPGVDKGSGMLWALRELGVSPERTVGVGDGENDVAFMRLCGIAAPVANAIAALHALPNAVRVRGSSGAGFREVARRVLRGDYDARLVPLEQLNLGV